MLTKHLLALFIMYQGDLMGNENRCAAVAINEAER